MLGPVDPVYRRNVTWLAGYRHPRTTVAGCWLTRCRRRPPSRRRCGRAYARFGDPLLVLPALFHALRAGRPAADLGAAMQERMPVWAPAAE